MRFAHRRIGDVTVVDLAGSLDGSKGPSLKEQMAALLADGHRRIVLNLEELTYLDSSALGELVACQLRATGAGATVKIANAGSRVQDLLLLTRLITAFDAHDSVDEAVRSFPE